MGASLKHTGFLACNKVHCLMHAWKEAKLLQGCLCSYYTIILIISAVKKRDLPIKRQKKHKAFSPTVFDQKRSGEITSTVPHYHKLCS